MKIEDALSRYLTQIRADGRSEHTVGQYRRHVGLLATWLRTRGHTATVEAIDHEVLAQFLSSPEARIRPDGRAKVATSTNALRTSLRTFFRYAHDAGYCRSNPARLIRRARCSAPPPRSLSDEEQGRLLQALAAGTGREAVRDHALFALMLGTGIRIGSALALETSDVDLDRGELRLRTTKGDAPVVVFVGRAVCAHLRSYVQGRRGGPLFTGRNQRALCQRHVQRRLSYWCERAGIQHSVKPHDLRHAFAIRIYKRTRDLLLVQKALRHRSIVSTTVYARSDDEDLRRVMAS